MQHIVYMRNIWTHETTEICRMPDSYSADRRSMEINTDLRLQGDTDHYSYIEPACGWDAALQLIAECNPINHTYNAKKKQGKERVVSYAEIKEKCTKEPLLTDNPEYVRKVKRHDEPER